MSEPMAARLRKCLTPDLVEAWRRDGAVCVRQMLSPDEVALLRGGIDANLAQPSPRAMDSQATWFPEGSLDDLPDIDAQRDRHRILGWAIEPGDVVCFHMLALHAAGGVDDDRRRRAFSVRFIGDDVRHAPRRWATSPNFPGLADELPPGAPMAHGLFPVLWEQAT